MTEKIRLMKPKKANGSEGDNITRLAVVLVVCAALVLGIVMVTGGKKSKRGVNSLAQASAPATTPGATSPATSPIIKPEEVEVPPLSIYKRRNPFKPLVNMEAVSVPTPTAGAGPAVVVVPPELEPEGSRNAGIMSRAITLEGVSEEGGRLFARVRVADQLFEKVGVGDNFGDSFKLLTLGKDSSATILFGDERFTLYVGQSIYL